MAKKPSAARAPRAANTAAKPAPGASPADTATAQGQPVHDPRPGADQQSQASNGAGAKPEGASASSGGAPKALPFEAFEVASIVVTGPKKGRWRSGLYFGPEPTELDHQAFAPAEGEPPHLAGERFYAILTDPRLTCAVRLDDGREEPFPPEVIEDLRQALDAAAEADA